VPQFSGDCGFLRTGTQGNASACSLTTHPRTIHGGREALRVLSDQIGVTLTQNVTIIPGQAGTFSGWLKTDVLTGAACFTADYLDAQGHAILS